MNGPALIQELHPQSPPSEKGKGLPTIVFGTIGGLVCGIALGAMYQSVAMVIFGAMGGAVAGLIGAVKAVEKF